MKHILIVTIFMMSGIWSHAAVTMNYDIVGVCAAGNHIDIDLIVVEGTDTIHVPVQATKQELKASISKEEGRAAALILLRYLLRQFPDNATNTQIRNGIEGKTIDLTIP